MLHLLQISMLCSISISELSKLESLRWNDILIFVFIPNSCFDTFLPILKLSRNLFHFAWELLSTITYHQALLLGILWIRWIAVHSDELQLMPYYMQYKSKAKANFWWLVSPFTNTLSYKRPILFWNPSIFVGSCNSITDS